MDSNFDIDKFHVCRTCMIKITTVSPFFSLDYTPPNTHLMINQKLHNCIPELDLNIVSNAVICSKCANTIKYFYEFKQKCLESEIQIKKYIQQIQHTGDVNLMEVVQFHKLHNKNLDTKFEIENFEVIEDNKNEDIHVFNEVDEGTESNKAAYLHHPHNNDCDIKVKMEKVETTEDFKIQDMVCVTNVSSEANEGTESIESKDLLMLEKIDRQYVLFNTFENYTDDSLSVEENSDINNSNIAQDSFSQNISKRDVFYQCYRCGHKAASKLKLILHLKRCLIHFYQKDMISKNPSKNYKNLFCYYRCSLCNYLTKHKCLFNFHNRTHLTKNYYKHIFQRKNVQIKALVSNLQVNKIYNTNNDKRKYINDRYNQHNINNRRKYISTHHFSDYNSVKYNTRTIVVKKTFNRSKSHIKRNHAGKKTFSCSTCEYQCTRKPDLNQHMRTHTGEKPFSCSVCEYQGNHKSNLNRHMQIHTEEKPFSCSLCKYQCRRKQHLKEHMGKHTGKKPFLCSVCLCQYNRKEDLKKHMRIHTGEKPFSCSVCGYQCSWKRELNQHMRIHRGPITFSCFLCEYQCSRKQYLRKHMCIHNTEKPFSCSVCEYQCNRKSDLNIHMRTHTGEKPFSCSVCEYKSSWKQDLKRHMRTHTGEKPFSCSICGHQCSRKSFLNQHMRTHTGEKPFSCSVCEYQCSQKQSLNRHMLIHTGEKPFACSICEYKGKQKQHLKDHMQTHS